MPVIPANPQFSDVQNILDAILLNNGTPNPLPHGIFWRQSPDAYVAFTSGNVAGVGIPIMNTIPGQELTSNFYVILTNPGGLSHPHAIPQMPLGGPYITEAGYQVVVNGGMMTGTDISDTLAYWLTHHYPRQSASDILTADADEPTKSAGTGDAFVGHWTYRSWINNPDPVDVQPEALKAEKLSELLFAEAEMIFESSKGGELEGKLNLGTDGSLTLYGSAAFGSPFSFRVQGVGKE